MKVLFLSTWFPYPPDNGSKIRVYHLLRALGAKHNVALLSFAFGTADPENVDELGHHCTKVETIPQDPFERSRVASALRFLLPEPVFTRPLPSMSRLVQNTLSEGSFDVVIASIEVMGTYAFLGPPSMVKVLEEHNSLTRWMAERYAEQSSILQRLRCWVSWQKTRYYEARLFRRFDLVTMVSEQDREISQNTLAGYRGRVEVIPNGVDCQHNRPGLVQPQPNTLIFNGALTYSSNYDAMQYFLAEVYPLIRRQVPDVSLTITGSLQGVDLSGLLLDESVRLSGYVEDIRPLVAGSAVCVTPIRQGGGTRLKILEAMALGTPVVATRKGAEGLEVAPEANILLADDPQEFAAQVVRLLGDPALQAYLSRNARQLVEEKYDWARIGQRFRELVELVVEMREETRCSGG